MNMGGTFWGLADKNLILSLVLPARLDKNQTVELHRLARCFRLDIEITSTCIIKAVFVQNNKGADQTVSACLCFLLMQVFFYQEI